MTQPSFFETGALAEPPAKSPDPAVVRVEVRKELTAVLDQARAGTAAAPPWSDEKTRYWRTVFPQMANWLPTDEVERMRAEFSSELARLDDERTLASFGYKIVTRAEFDVAIDVPAGSTREVIRQLAGAFIVYDPEDDDEGWLLVGDSRAELARETVEYRCQPPSVPPA
jgi:hypothetical protein